MTAATPKAPELTPEQQEIENRKAILAELRKTFPPSDISMLPKQLNKNDTGQNMPCKAGTQASADGRFCGGYHRRSIHLDYVGHAALTQRMLNADPFWDWRPLALTPAGTPMMTDGGMWIELTIGGMTRLGFGDAQGKSGPNAIKEIIGDALRNAGMRFGMALDLWHKGDLSEAELASGQHESQQGSEEAPPAAAKPATRAAAKHKPEAQGAPEAPAEVAPAAEPKQTRAEADAAVTGTDWVAKAESLTRADDVLRLWQQAKSARATQEVLDKVKDIGSDLREVEAAAQKAAAEFADQGVSAVAEGFNRDRAVQE